MQCNAENACVNRMWQQRAALLNIYVLSLKINNQGGVPQR